MKHRSAQPSHYDQGATDYDAIQEEKNNGPLNAIVERQLRDFSARSVLDVTCGTGSQVFWLARKGFQACGSDFNAKMLRIATKKAYGLAQPPAFHLGDIRNVNIGRHDAVISMSNSIGHLTKAGFQQALRNIRRNLHPRGLYVFDIFNRSYLLSKDNITKLTIDWLVNSGEALTRSVQYSTLSLDGVLASYTTNIRTIGDGRPYVTTERQTLQIYTREELKEILSRNGFRVLRHLELNNRWELQKQGERMLVVARRID